jgi:hypothetical protein
MDGCGYELPENGFLVTRKIDNVTYTAVTGWQPPQGAEASQYTCPSGGLGVPGPLPADGDGDGSSDGQDPAPNNPGEGAPQPADPPPGTCGGAGQPACPSQESDPNKSSGGGNCKTAPSSTGDPILAQIAFQTWATRCEGEKAVIALNKMAGIGNGTSKTATAGGGEGCAQAPVCTNDPVNCALLHQVWKGRCTNSHTASGGTCGADGGVLNFSCSGDEILCKQTLLAVEAKCKGDATYTGPTDTTHQAGLDTEGQDDGQGNGFVVEGEEIGADGLDDSGLGYGRTCPASPTVSVMGASIEFDTGPLCTWLQLGGLFVLVLSALASLRIIAGGV